MLNSNTLSINQMKDTSQPQISVIEYGGHAMSQIASLQSLLNMKRDSKDQIGQLPNMVHPDNNIKMKSISNIKQSSSAINSKI